MRYSISRILSKQKIFRDNHLSQRYTRVSSATKNLTRQCLQRLFYLAPDRVYPLSPLLTATVRSYRTFSPFPYFAQGFVRWLFSVALSIGFSVLTLSSFSGLYLPGFPRYPHRLESGLSSRLLLPLRRACPQFLRAAL